MISTQRGKKSSRTNSHLDPKPQGSLFWNLRSSLSYPNPECLKAVQCLGKQSRPIIMLFWYSHCRHDLLTTGISFC